MKVIGAGLPRAATTTQMFAFETLGFGSCYHMRDLLADLEGGLPHWEQVAAGDADWEQILAGRESCCDWPTSRYYRELAEYYPEAKVILSVRDAEAWTRSMIETVWAVYFGPSVLHHVCEARRAFDPLWDRYINLMTEITWAPGTGALAVAADDADRLGEAMESWNAEVERTIPAERLLVWNPSEGYEPLCEFLEVPTPDDPLPRLNDTKAFKEGITGGAINALNDWWDAREQPSEGLHGASLKQGESA